MFGEISTYGFFIRHVKEIELGNVEVSYLKEDPWPTFVRDDVKGADFRHVKSQQAAFALRFVLKNVEDFSVFQSRPVPDTRLERVEQKKL